MAFANVMTFNDPDESIRVKTGETHVFIYWQVGNYLAVNIAEARKLRDDLSKAITEAATASAMAKAEVVA